MNRRQQSTLSLLMQLLAVQTGWAATNDFQRQIITLPAAGMTSHFADIDGDGRLDLLAVDPAGGKLLIYRQRETGFPGEPDQTIKLPPHTAWISPFDVDAHAGLELLLSTAAGFSYFRQNAGVFETELRPLIQAEQVFTQDDAPVVMSLPPGAGIPLITATQSILYQRTSGFEWRPGAPVALHTGQATWQGNRDDWTMGSGPSHWLIIKQSVRARLEDSDDAPPENEGIRKLLAELKNKTTSRHKLGQSHADLDGDGRKDLVIWEVLWGGKNAKTDAYVFMRGADNKLPEQPTQVLHCRGLPVPVGSTRTPSLVADLRGDGHHQLVLVEVTSTLTSVGSAVDMALSKGLELAFTIRPFERGGFSRIEEVSAPLTAIFSVEGFEEWPIFVSGDFTGDGRPDIVVRRSATQWNVYPSTADARWFSPQPSLSFETPMDGAFEIADLNGDGRADIILRAKDDPRVCVFLSPGGRTKGKP